MIRERSAGPQMISRLGHRSLVACVRECALVLCAKPAICMDLQEGTCFEDLHIWQRSLDHGHEQHKS